jgi:hypothetical protein
MITKDQLVATLIRDCEIVQHLATKLSPDAYDYRPSSAQRSTIELMRYMSICMSMGLLSVTDNDWKRWGEAAKRANAMGPEGFHSAMEQQKEDIRAYFADKDEQFFLTHEGSLPPAHKLPLGAAIIGGPLKWLASYKMQLFLYAKANGADIGTSNVWGGMDLPPQAAV